MAVANVGPRTAGAAPVAVRRPHGWLAIPATVILLAWLLRVWHLDYYDFRGDEVFGIFYVEAPLGQVIGTLAQGEPHPPLFYLLLHYWIPVVGDGEYALRWLSAAGGALGVALLCVLGRRIAGPPVGAVAALILTLAPYHIWNAQDARMYTLASALVTAAAYWTWRLLTDATPSRRAALGYVLAMLLALYTHYYSIYMAVLLNAFALALLVSGPSPGLASLAGALRAPLPGGEGRERARRQPRRHPLPRGEGKVRARLWIAAQAVVVLLYVPWVAYAWRTLTTYHGNAGSPALGDALRSALQTFAVGWDLPQGMAAPLLPLFVAVAFLGMVACARLRAGWAALLLLLLWLTLPIGAIWLASRARPIFDVRYLIEASPPFYLLLALPLVWWRRRSIGAIVAGVAVAATLAALIPALGSLYFHPTDGRGHAYSALSRYLAMHATAADVVIINHLDPVVRYYARRGGVAAPMVVEPTQQDESGSTLNATLSRLTAGKRDVWLIPDDIGAWDTRHAVLAWANRHLDAQGQVTTSGFHLLKYQPWTPTAAANVTFGSELTLIGIRLDPATPAAGQPWQVVLFWRAPQPTPASETVSVQLLNSAGQLAAQEDAVPQAGAAPTTDWQPYETIPDPHTLRLPATLPAGRFTVGIAVYPSAGGARLPAPGVASGLAPVATVTVR